MSNCCSSNGTEQQHTSSRICPACGVKGKAVGTLTVKQIVIDHTSVGNGSYSFCHTPSCNVAYFAPGSIFGKADIKVRVGIKEDADPVPLCYCFDYSREDIWRDIEAKGETSVLEEIKNEVQGGFCACEVKNPSGTCCLGDITRAIQEAKKHAAGTLHASH